MLNDNHLRCTASRGGSSLRELKRRRDGVLKRGYLNPERVHDQQLGLLLSPRLGVLVNDDEGLFEPGRYWEVLDAECVYGL